MKVFKNYVAVLISLAIAISSASVIMPMDSFIAQAGTEQNLITIGDVTYSDLSAQQYPGMEAEDGYCVMSCDTSATEITIPESVDGKPVLGFGYAPFTGCENLEVLNIELGEDTPYTHALTLSSLRECVNLKEINLPDHYIPIDAQMVPDIPAIGTDGNSYKFIGDYIVGITPNMDEYGYTNFIYDLTIPEGYKYICERAFSNCDIAESIYIPADIEYIGTRAFGGEDYGPFVYNACPYVDTVKFAPDSKLKYIGDYAFCSVRNMKKVNIPASVEYIGESAFRSTDIRAVTINNPNTVIGATAFSEPEYVVMPALTTDVFRQTFVSYETNYISMGTSDSGIATTDPLSTRPWKTEVYYLGTEEQFNAISFKFSKVQVDDSTYSPEFNTTDNLFNCNIHYNCYTVEKDGMSFVVSPDDGYSFMTDCDRSLTEVIIPAEIDGYAMTTIGQGAFIESSLQSIDVPDTVKFIGDAAFDKCKSLGSIHLKGDTEVEAVNSIDYDENDNRQMISTHNFGNIVGDCESLAEIIQDCESSYFKIENNMVYSLEGKILYYCPPCIKDVIFSNTIETFGKSCFNGYQGIELNIPNTITNISEGALYKLPNIKKLTIPGSVTSTISRAIGNCDNLEEIVFEEGVTNLYYTISACESLKKVYLPDSLERVTELVQASAYTNEYPTIYAHAGTIGAKFGDDNSSYTTMELIGDKVAGDADGDEMVTASDASLVLSVYAVMSTTESTDDVYALLEEQGISKDVFNVADISGDGMIMADDASSLLGYYAYLSTGGTKGMTSFLSENSTKESES